jgi:endonuclease/exonuclease/phosphatase (EEP) superfamily protein YafD
MRENWLSLRAWVSFLAGGTEIATLLGFAGRLWWGFSFLDHPRPQYSLVLFVALLVGLTSRQSWQWHLLWLLPLTLNLWLLSPLFIFPSPASALSSLTSSTPAPPSFRILHATLDHDNPDLNPAIQFLNQQRVDVLSLLEVTPESLVQLQAGLNHYRLVAAEPRNNSHGSAWFISTQSSQPIQMRSHQVIHLPADSDRPLLTTTLSIAGQEIVFLCFHTIRPRSAGTVAYQRVEFEALNQWSHKLLQTGQGHGIVVGDFNSTPWSESVRQVLRESGLLNSQQGFGLQPTWHSVLPTFLRIPIDYCLHTPSLITKQRTIGPNIGSDHLPIVVELEWNLRSAFDLNSAISFRVAGLQSAFAASVLATVAVVRSV